MRQGFGDFLGLCEKIFFLSTIPEGSLDPSQAEFFYNIRFLEDKWLGSFTLKEQYPSLYNIARKKQVSVAQVFSSRPLNLMFRRALICDKLAKWNALVAKVAFVQLDDQRDLIIWNFNNKGSFVVQSMYKHLVKVNQTALLIHKAIWKLKLPLQIKFFIWFFMKEVIN
jgi:hypothetical protein